MTNVFAVVGQQAADPCQLLLLGDDGRFYAYAPDGRLRPVDPTDGWRLDEDSVPPADEASGDRRPRVAVTGRA